MKRFGSDPTSKNGSTSSLEHHRASTISLPSTQYLKVPVKSRQSDHVIERISRSGRKKVSRWGRKKVSRWPAIPTFPNRARKGRAGNMAVGDAQNVRIRPFQNHHGDVNAGNCDPPDDVSGSWLDEHMI